MSGRPTDQQAHEALQSLLAAAFPNGNGPSADSIPYPSGHHHNGGATSSSSTDDDSLQTSGDGTPQEQQGHFMQALTSLAAGTDSSMLHSHTMALLAAQPGLLPGLTFAPPSPGPRTRSNSVVPPTPQQHHASYYTPLPTRSGRVPHVPDPSAGAGAEPARETMLFNDYFDWPSSDDEDDPDFQPQAGGAGWGDIVIGQGGGVFSPEEEDDDDDYGTDFSIVDEGFMPGDMTGVQDSFSQGGLGSDDILVGGGGPSTSRLADAFALPGDIPVPSTRSSRSTRLTAAIAAVSSSPAASPAFVPPLPPRPRETTATVKGKGKGKGKASTAARPRKRARTTLSPLPEDPIELPELPELPQLPDLSVDPLPLPGEYVPSPALYTLATPASSFNTPAPIAPAPPDGDEAPEPAPKTKGKGKKRPSTGGVTKVLEDGTVKKVRGISKKLGAMTDEQREEHKKALARQQAKEARERKKKLMKGFEQRCAELEKENELLKARVKELEKQQGWSGNSSAQGSASREQSWAPESVVESEEEEDELEEDESLQRRTQPPPAPALGALDISFLSPNDQHDFIKLVNRIAEGSRTHAGVGA